MLELKNVCAGYDRREVLHGVSAIMEAGKITVLAGPNGCGKSTLLKTAAGMLEKTAGEIIVDQKTVEQYRTGELAKKIAYLPQSRNVPDISVRRMVLHGRFPYLSYPRHYGKKDLEITEQALQWVGMQEYADKNMNELSGGMQQKVYIAMALAQDTPVIMMDEPTTFLDIVHQAKLMEITRKLADEGKAVVLVLHDLSAALRIADQIVVMRHGEIAGKGSSEEVFESGILDEVFGIRICRVQTENGWQYYYGAR